MNASKMKIKSKNSNNKNSSNNKYNRYQQLIQMDDALFDDSTFDVNVEIQSRYTMLLVNAVKNLVNAYENETQSHFFIDHILIPVIASVFAVENTPLPVHQELVNICRIFLRKHRVIVSAHPDIGEYYAVARIPKRQIEQLEKGEKLDESWTLNLL